jgi:hypothetical protein
VQHNQYGGLDVGRSYKQGIKNNDIFIHEEDIKVQFLFWVKKCMGRAEFLPEKLIARDPLIDGNILHQSETAPSRSSARRSVLNKCLKAAIV